MRRILLCLVGILLSNPAYAYRPFNSTDAAVAERGEMELECGPVGYVVDAEGRFLVVPSFILNFGVAEGWEIVFEGRNFVRVELTSADQRATLRETALSLKGLLRQGSLQEHHSGPSVGLEVGVLLPGAGAGGRPDGIRRRRGHLAGARRPLARCRMAGRSRGQCNASRIPCRLYLGIPTQVRPERSAHWTAQRAAMEAVGLTIDPIGMP